jgi:type IV pilus assembly protein PilC
MANFQYTALDAKGEQTSGTLQAATDAEAIQMLRSQGLYPTQVVEEGNG